VGRSRAPSTIMLVNSRRISARGSVDKTPSAWAVPVEQSLPAHLLAPILEPVTHKSFRSPEPYVRVGELLQAKLEAFETGAVLGAAMKDRFRVLSRMLVWSDGFDSIADGLMEEGRSHLDLARHLLRDVPAASLIDVFLLLEFPSAGRASGDFLSATGKKVKLTLATEFCPAALIKGLGLGAADPEYLESIWRNMWAPQEGSLRTAYELMGAPLTLPVAFCDFGDRKAELVLETRRVAERIYKDLLATSVLWKTK